MPKITVDHLQMYYEQHGQGPDLVIINGLTADHTSFDFVISQLSEHFRVTVFDNRGVGQTDAPKGSYSTLQMAEDTASLLQALGIESAYVVGHSMGGMIAHQLALKYPHLVNRLAIVCSMAEPYARALAWLDFGRKQMLANVAEELIFEEAIMYCFSREFIADTHKVEAAIAYRKSQPYPQSLAAYESQLAAVKNHDFLNHLPQIKQPTLVIAGEDDILTPPEFSQRIVERMPNAILKVIPGAHLPNVEHPELLGTLLADFYKARQNG